MNKTAILYICTGKYEVLWKEFYESAEKFFIPDAHKEYFVFTDAKKIEYEENNTRIHRLPQESLAWPYATLLRFKMFCSIKEEILKFDYVFFFNANAKIIKPISENMILPTGKKDGGLTVVIHPAYFKCERYDFPYDRNFNSLACVKHGHGKVYVQGCLIGGNTKAFYKMSEKLNRDIDKDLSKGIIALWHDESYLNRYIIGKKYKLLPPTFACNIFSPNDEDIIHMRPKQLYFDVDNLKANERKAILSKRNERINLNKYRKEKRRKTFFNDIKYVKEEKGFIYSVFWAIKNFYKVF